MRSRPPRPRGHAGPRTSSHTSRRIRIRVRVRRTLAGPGTGVETSAPTVAHPAKDAMTRRWPRAPVSSVPQRLPA
ncbi:hypothetical protein KDA82_35565, partial [Streptomyces daliensis]|nr:hypothetical protein [Streptomyces daliensis]